LTRNVFLVDLEEGADVFKGLASSARLRILKLLHDEGALNINDIASKLGLPQSTVSSSAALLERGRLISTEVHKARKGNQKMCHLAFDEVLISFKDAHKPEQFDGIEVAMPIGLYTSFEVTAPYGLCMPDGIVGLLDVPAAFLDPDRMKAGLLWFTRGFVEYQFPNNAKLAKTELDAISFSLELSSEVPGTSADWPSDITVTVNGVDIGTWTSPGDFGDKRGVYTPDWWKLKGSQYGKLKNWRVGQNGTYVDGIRISPVSLADIDLARHHSIRLRIGVHKDAAHPGGINIFGRGFGNYDQDIVLRLHVK